MGGFKCLKLYIHEVSSDKIEVTYYIKYDEVDLYFSTTQYSILYCYSRSKPQFGSFFMDFDHNSSHMEIWYGIEKGYQMAFKSDLIGGGSLEERINIHNLSVPEVY